MTGLDWISIASIAAMITGPTLAWLRLLPGLPAFALFAIGGLLTIVVAVVNVVRLLRGRGLSAPRAAAFIPALIFILIAARGRSAPRINDFTTDLDDPPKFEAVQREVANMGRDMSYPAEFAEQQRACCPDLASVHLPVPASEAFARAKQVAEQAPDWTILVADPVSGRIEGYAETKVFGFRDDLVIRVRPDGASASIVDARSKSRDGQGDMGTNAERLRRFTAALGGEKSPSC